MIRPVGHLLMFAWLGSWLLGCGPWDLAALEARHPALREVGSAPLSELTPYFIAEEDRLTAFVCRWPSGARLGVEVVGSAGPEDLRVLDGALAAWEGAGLGLSFERGAVPVSIRVRFDDASRGRSGVAAVDCRVRSTEGDPLDASLAFAQITLRREATNWKGHRVALDLDERMGAALHELGHALGFQGHPQRGETVMVRSVDHVRWVGERVAGGQVFRDSALAALYALPNGSVLGRRSLPPGSTHPIDTARTTPPSPNLGWHWSIRVGDRAALLHGGPGTAAFTVLRVDEIFRNPSSFALIPRSEL